MAASPPREVTTMDTEHLKQIAEQHISATLLRAKILVAKPLFDINGTDLLGFTTVSDGAKFCRIQSKLRSLLKSDDTASITIPKDYVQGAFVVLLCVNVTPDPARPLPTYCFFVNDIEQWTCNESGKYVLSFTAKNFKDKLAPHELDEARVAAIIAMLAASDAKREWSYVGSGGITFGGSVPTGHLQVLVDNAKYFASVVHDKKGKRTVVREVESGREWQGLDCPGSPVDYEYDPEHNSWTLVD